MAHGLRATTEETVASNMGLVRKCIAKHFRSFERYGASEDDVLQMGALGLVKAHETYDPAKGAFSTHAFWKIRGEITSGLRAYGAHDAYTHLDGRWNHLLLSQLGDGEEQPTIEASADEEEAPDVVAAASDEARMLRVVMRRMPSRMAKVLRLRHFEGLSHESIGRHLGVSRERARQIETQALLIAREQIEARQRNPKRLLNRKGLARLRDSQRRLIVADYFDTDLTMAAVAEKWCLSGASTIYQMVAGPIAARLFGEEQAAINARRVKAKRGRAVAAAKRRISLDQVREIRGRFRAGTVRVTDLASEFGVNRNTISCLLYGRGVYGKGVYASLDPLPAPGGKRRLTFEQAECIRARYAAGGETMYDLAAEFGVSYSTVRTILHGKAYQRIPGKPGRPGVAARSIVAAVDASLGVDSACSLRSAAAQRRWARERQQRAASEARESAA